MMLRLNYPYTTPEAEQRARSVMLVSTTLAVMAALVLMSALISDILGVSLGGWAIYAITLAIIGIAIGVRRLVQSGHHLFASHIVVVTLMLSYLLTFLFDPSAQSVALIGFLVPIVAAALLSGPAAMFLVSLVMGGVVAVTIGIQLQTNTYPDLPDPEQNSVAVAVTFLASLGLLLVIAYQYIVNARLSLQRAFVVQSTISATRRVQSLIHNLSDLSNDSLRTIVEALRDEFAAYYVQLFMQDADNRMTLRVATGLIGERGLMQGEDVLMGTGSPALAYQRKLPVVTSMSASELQRANFLVGTRVEVALPVMVGDQVIGLLILQSEDPNAFAESVVGLLENVTADLGLVIEQQQLRQHVADYEKRLDQNSQIMQWYQREVNRLTQEIQGQVWGDYLEGKHDRISVRLQDNQLVSLEDVDGAVVERPRLEVTAEGRQVLAVPIRQGQQLIGEMVFEAPAEAGWSRQTLDLVVAVSNRLSLALENLRLFDQAQRVALREQTVSQVAAELQDARHVELLLNQAVSMFNRVLNAEQTHIRLGQVQDREAG